MRPCCGLLPQLCCCHIGAMQPPCARAAAALAPGPVTRCKGGGSAPLGKLTPQQIEKGQAVLEKISTSLSTGDRQRASLPLRRGPPRYTAVSKNSAFFAHGLVAGPLHRLLGCLLFFVAEVVAGRMSENTGILLSQTRVVFVPKKCSFSRPPGARRAPGSKTLHASGQTLHIFDNSQSRGQA